MSHQHRQTLAEFAIGVLACAGAYLMLVDPAIRSTAKVESEIETLRAQAAEAGVVASLTETQVADLRKVALERAERIRARSAYARDEAGLFAAIMALGERHGVRIDQLQPGQSGTLNELGRIAPPQAAAPPGPPQPPPTGAGPGTQAAAAPPTPAPVADFKAGYTIFLTGPYARVVALLADLQSTLGYASVRSVRLAPMESDNPQGEHVSATIETEHLAIDLSAVRLAPAPQPAQAAATDGGGAP
jgi:hypothetical protein